MSKKSKKKIKEVIRPNYYLLDLEKHRDKSKEYRDYAIKRFDILIITISTVGLGFVANYIKEIEFVNLTLPYISICSFGLCLFLNLFAQLFSRKTNGLAVKKADNNLYFNRYDDYPNGLSREQFDEIQSGYSCKMSRYNLVVEILDIISFVLLITAIIVFLCFTFFALE